MAAPPPRPGARQSVFQAWNPTILHFFQAIPLRDHQRASVQRIVENFDAGHSFGQLVLPTGCGKSGIAVILPYYMNVPKALVIAPFPELATQFAQQFSGPPRLPGSPFPDRQDDAFLFKISFDQAIGGPPFNHNEAQRRGLLPRYPYHRAGVDAIIQFDDDLVVINPQRIRQGARLQVDDLPLNYDLLIVDEAHHYPAPTWRAIVERYQRLSPDTKILFLTATPNMDQAAPRVPVFLEFSFQQMVLAGAIRDIHFTEVDSPDKQTMQVLVARLKEIIIGFSRLQRGFYQAMIAVEGHDVQHVLALYNNGVVDPRERAEPCRQEDGDDVVRRFKNGRFRTVVVIHRLMEGFDHPNVAFVAVARNMRMRTFNQFVGRATRIADGNFPVAQVLSHSRFAQRGNFDAMRGGNWAIAQEQEEEEAQE